MRDFLARWWDWRPSGRGVIALTGATLLVMWVSGQPAWLVGLIVAAVGAAVTALLAFAELYGAAGAGPAEVNEEPAEVEQPPAGGAFAVAPNPDPARHVDLRKDRP